MKVFIIASLSLVLSFSMQKKSATIVKKNGDAIRLTDLSFVQSSSGSGSSDLLFSSNGRSMKISSTPAKRINLKGVAEKKKGVVTWHALLVQPNGNKLEITLDLDGVSGKNEKGSVVGISSNSIDKISF